MGGRSSSQGKFPSSGQKYNTGSIWWISEIKGGDGSSWSRKILCLIFTYWNKLWDTRNQDLHGKDTSTRAKATKDQAIKGLNRLYTNRQKVLQQDTSLFFPSLEDHKLLPSHSIRQWINTYQHLILRSAKDAKTKSLLHVRPITAYFGTGWSLDL